MGYPKHRTVTVCKNGQETRRVPLPPWLTEAFVETDDKGEMWLVLTRKLHPDEIRRGFTLLYGGKATCVAT